MYDVVSFLLYVGVNGIDEDHEAPRVIVDFL